MAATRSALRLIDAAPFEETARSRRSRAVAAVAAALLVLAAVAAFVLMRDSGGLASVSPDSVGVIDPHSNRLTAEIQVGRDPQAIATGLGSVWVATTTGEIVYRIDPADTTARPATIPVDDYPSDLTTGSGSTLVALGALAELQVVNPEQNRSATPTSALGGGLSCGAPRASIAFGGGFAWFVCEGGYVGRVDVPAGRATEIAREAGLLQSPSSTLPQFSDVAFGLGSLWIVNRAANAIIELDPLTSQKKREITVSGQQPTAIAVGDGALWVANFGDDSVTKIGIPGPGETATLTNIDVGDGPVDVAVGENAIWVANQLARTVTRIDPESGDVETTIDVGNAPQRIAAGEGFVWLTVGARSDQQSTP